MLIFINCNKTQYDTNKLIEFVHIGIVNHPIPPLYISTEKIDIHLNKRQIAELQKIIGKNVKITTEKVQQYIKVKYNLIVTDKKTFRAVSEFIYSNKDFYTNSDHQNNDPNVESYNVHINGVNFSIYYKLKEKYFDNMKVYLSRKECDTNVIKAFSYL
jgi:hypothetical protein